MGLARLVEVAGGGQTLIAQVSDGDLPAQPPTLPQPLLDATLAQHGRPVSAGGEALGSAAAARGLDHCIALAVTRAGKSSDAPEALLLVLWGQQQHSQLNEPSAQLLRLTAQRIAAVRAQQRMERDLVQAKERETIGHLVSGVAHDFNNLLGAIDANLFFLHDSCTQCGGADAEIEQVLEETRTALDQAKVITSGMLSMSRGGSVPLALVPLGASLGELVGILRHVLPQSITLDVALADGLTAWTNSSFLQAALLNLALNARDAMPGGGDLRIAAAPRYWHGQDSLALGYLAPGECIEVSVSDTGGGIPPHILSRIFEPLFSTKARGRGHGLGLFMVKEFVLRSGAGLVIETATGKGTRFCLLLPAQPPRSRSHTEPVVDAPSPRPERQTAEPSAEGDAEADAETDAEAAAPAASLAGLRVLVVEDEPRVREAVGRLLRLGGIEVAFAGHGADALARLREEPAFDLVLTDIAMPVMDGPTLYRQLRDTYPQLPVLMMTGQAGKTAEETAADATVLRKPLEAVEVYTEIRRICRLGTRPTEP